MSNTFGVRVIEWLKERQVLLPMPQHQLDTLSRQIDALMDWPDSRRTIDSMILAEQEKSEVASILLNMIYYSHGPASARQWVEGVVNAVGAWKQARLEGPK